MVILGLGDGTDAGAALVVDDHLVAATEQERLDRSPRSRAFPWEAIDDVLQQGGLTPADVDLVAVAGRFTPPFFVRRHPRARTLATDPFSPARDASVFWQAMLRQSGFGAMEADRAAEWVGARLTERGFRQQRVIMVDVHRALAAAAYRTQRDDHALVVTLHPMGDGAAMAVHVGGSGQLDRVFVQRGFAALHVHLARCAAVIGLDDHQENILWGLAARGEPSPDLVSALHDELHADGERLSRRAYPVPDRRSQRPWRDLAAAQPEVAAASVLENLKRAVLGVARAHVARHRRRTLVLGGGVLDNPRLVAALASVDGVRRVETCPLQGWASLPLGAAVTVGGLAPTVLRPPGVGPPPDPDVCRAALPEASTFDAGLAADVLAAGGAVARYAGPQGFARDGSGTRSVLVRADDPVAVRRAREALGRPEAAEPGLAALTGVIEVEDAAALAGPTLYGAAAPRVLGGADAVAGAVTADGRVHLHCVQEGDDPGLASILAALGERTGVPAVALWPLGTGNEPAAGRAADAMGVWRRSRLSGLQLGPCWLRSDG